MDEAPKTFGRYEVLRTLGSGGMGEILLARQRGVAGVDRLVVLKTVLPHLAREPGFIERFLDEMRVSMLLTHGNIVQVHDVGEEDGRHYMAMEWVEGLDLREVLLRLDRAGRSMPEEVALYVLVEASKGLAYAHARRDPSGRSLALVHRDVSPANILISNDGQVKITDFGVAVATARLSFSLPGTLHGKVAYMSPEQVDGADLDGRSDQFSLGVVAYEMLCGERPFEGEGDVAILEQVRRCEPRPLWEAAPWLDLVLARIVMRALSRDPDARFPSMDEFGGALCDYQFTARKVVTARTVAEFMATLTGAGEPAENRQRWSLDDVARDLLPAGASDQKARVTIEARSGGRVQGVGEWVRPEVGRAAVASPEGRFSAWHVVGAIALLASLAGGMWFLGRIMAGWPADSEGDDGVAQTDVQSAVADTGPGPAGAGPEDAGTPEVVLTPSEQETAPLPEARRTVLVRSVPEGAAVFHGSRRLGTTPLTVTVSGSRGMRLDLRYPDHEDAAVTLGPDSPGLVAVPLPPVPMGRVRFRFFPADARVLLDDVSVPVRGNVVDRAVSAGEHVLTVRSREDGGPMRTVRFEVRPDQVVEMGTIELPAGP